MPTDLDLLRLNLVPGMTPRATVVLLERFGTAAAALGAGPAMIRQLPDIGPRLASRLADPPSVGDARAEARRAARQGIDILCRGEEVYPEHLLTIPDPPSVLYVRGVVREDPAAVAVVGARRASLYGRVQAERFGRELSRSGLSVVSGLARGVDGAAHRGAIDGGGRTVAVLGSGLDRIYPAEHRGLAREVAKRGMVCSEFPLGSRPLRHHFPMRNRIIAGLVEGIVVIEGRLRSGSLITARLGADFGRSVFALPGRVDSELSAGPHSVIREGAILVSSPEHVLLDLGHLPLDAPEAPPAPADPLQCRILELLRPADAIGVDEILRRLGAEAPAVLAALTALELSGRVRVLPGRRIVSVRES